jgi:nitrite reductase (NADH) large subunit
VGRRRIVIVGASAAGLSALAAIRMVDSTSLVTVVSAEAEPAYSRVMLPHLVSGERRSALLHGPGFFRDMDAATVFGRRAAAVGRDDLLMEDGERFPFDALLIATGAVPRVPPVEGAAASGVYTLRTLADAEAIGRRLERTGRALVIGAGRICVLAARALLARGVRVEVVELQATILSGMLDCEASARAQARLERLGIHIRTGTEVVRILAGPNGVEAAITSSGDEIRAELVIVGAGNLPDAAIAAPGGTAASGGILVDERMRTSVDGVYAAGDVAEAPDMLSRGERTTCGTWSEATRQGRIAGLNMAGRAALYDGSLRLNALDVLGLPAASIGLTEPPDAASRAVRMTDGEVYRKLVLRDGRLLGAVLLGAVEDAGVLAGLVRTGAPIDALRAERLSRRARFGDVLRASLPA